MLSLILPVSQADEDDDIKAICARKGWGAHQTSWLQTYALYRRRRGNAWAVPHTPFAGIEDKQKGYYKHRSGKPPISTIRSMRIKCCSMCGAHHNTSVDHFLPRADYSEFSIMPSNLVPACASCNSAAKGSKVKGTSAIERFFHPYYDNAARQPLWLAEVTGPYAAATFSPKALPHLPARLRARVDFHFSELLSDAFDSYCETLWPEIPIVIRQETGPAPSIALVQSELQRLLRDFSQFYGVNGWSAALYRGILVNPAAIAHVHSKV